MATLNTIRTVSVRYQSEGADRFRSDADAAAASQASLAQATEQAATVSEQSARRQLSAASAYDRVRASVDANYRSQLAMERATRTVDRALQQGVIDGSAYERTLAQIQARFTTTTTAADRMAAAWRNLGAVGEANSRLLTPAGRLATLSSDGSVQFRPGAGPAAAGRRLRADETQNLLFQGIDVATSLQGGMNPLTVALQQGGQVLPMFVGSGGASLKESFKQATEAAGGFLTKIGPVGIGLGALGVAATAGALAFMSYRSGQAEAEKAIGGIGRVAGVTLGQVNALADAQAKIGGMSRGSARDIAAIYAGTGGIGGAALGSALGATRDFSKFMGVDQSEGATALASALADVSKGANDLSQRYGLLNDTQAESVRQMDAQGDRLGAQKRLLDAVRESTRGLAEQTTGWGRITEWVANRWDELGEGVDRAVTGGDLDTRLKTAQDALAEARREAEGSNRFYRQAVIDPRISAYESQIAELTKRTQARDAVFERAQRGRRSAELGGIVRSLLPEQQEFERLQNQVERVRRAISDPVRFGLEGGALGQTEAAFARISQTLKTMAEDIARFGSAAAAAANRTAEFANRTVGFTPSGRSAAEVQRNYEEEARRRAFDPNGPSSSELETSFNARLNQPGLNFQDLYKLTQQRDEEMRAALERDSFRRARDIELDTIRKTQSLEQTQSGGAFSRLSKEIQQQLLTASQNPRYARIPVGIAAAITGPESQGNLDIGYSKSLGEDGRPSSAYGLGQITRGTAADAVRRGFLPPGFDRMNRDTMGEGILGVLSMKLADNDGDLTKAIMAYRGSNKPGVNEAYAAKVMRDAGQLGDPSATAQVRQQDEYNRALRDQQQQLANVTQNYGRNGAAMEAASLAAQRYNALLDAGVPPSQALAASIQDLATKTTSVAQQIKLTQFAADVGFEREQLGRTAIEQSAYAQARSRIGDTTSEGARYIIQETQANARLFESKAAVTDAMGGFVTDLRRGTDAASAFSSMLGRLADRALNGLTDSLVSGLFSAGSKGGAASGGLGGIFASIGSVFGFANGGIMGPNGPLPLRAYSSGGIADSPQLALYGEGRMPEAYVPLPDGRRIPVAMQGGGAANANTAASNPGPMELTVKVDGANGDAQIRSMVAQGVAEGIGEYNRQLDRTLGSRMLKVQQRAAG
ncbi:phage tail length tape measure family protein [Methylorubrum thiocyanatum]|uniref:phage tail length tape measure family protein n=1 Tax=Methylorubrum thiocyanatum TaxID=47958 RepID=UPI0035C7F87D